MIRRSEMSRGNPVPGFPQTPSAARRSEEVPSTPEGKRMNPLVPQVSEYSRPRRPQR
jgi:hypothetical protein